MHKVNIPTVNLSKATDLKRHVYAIILKITSKRQVYNRINVYMYSLLQKHIR